MSESSDLKRDFGKSIEQLEHDAFIAFGHGLGDPTALSRIRIDLQPNHNKVKTESLPYQATSNEVA